jgi:hypothetical protein
MSNPEAPRALYDSTQASGIPPVARLVAGYGDGAYEWSGAEWRLLHPDADAIVIATTAANYGDVLDVESGDARPEEAAGWIAMRKQAGLAIPTIYVERLNIPAVRTGTGTWKLNEDYDLWVGDWTNSPHQVIAAGPGAELPCAVTQYQRGGPCDISAVYDPRWPRRQAPATPTVLAAMETIAAYLQGPAA